MPTGTTLWSLTLAVLVSLFVTCQSDDGVTTSTIQLGNARVLNVTLVESEQLLSVDNDTSTGLLGWTKNHMSEWMKRPYVAGVVLPVLVGVGGALATFTIVCSVRACVRSSARRRRKRRIRNLADELKSDRSMLLAESSDDEF